MELSFKSFFFREQAAAARKRSSRNLACGSGTIISPNGIVLTANHVVDQATKIFVINKFEIFSAKLVKSLPESDVAVLKILEAEKKFEYCPVSEKPRFTLGSPVFNISFPNIKDEGFDPKLAKSYISCEESPFSQDYFQIEAELSEGSSGSAIFNRSGEIIGIVSCHLFDAEDLGNTPHNVTYAVKSDRFNKALKAYASRQSSPSPSSLIGPAKAASVIVLSRT